MRLAAAVLVGLVLAGGVDAVTLTVTPDKSTYLVGETITLSVLGDSGDVFTWGVLGVLVFEEDLASVLSASQDPLTSFMGAWVWAEGALLSGPGFVYAFNQLGPQDVAADNQLTATVTLLARSAGTLTYAWDNGPEARHPLDYFRLPDAPGGSVTIVPEPATAFLLGLGLAGLRWVTASHQRRSARDQMIQGASER